MQTRRSTRIAANNNASTPIIPLVSIESGQGEEDAVFSQRTSPPEPCTPSSSSTPSSSAVGRRPRGRPKAAATLFKDPVTPTDMTIDFNMSDLSPFANDTPIKPGAFRQKSPRRNSKLVTTPIVEPSKIAISPCQNEISLVNDSFLCAVGQLEEQFHKENREMTPPPREEAIETAKFKSPNIFEDDDDDLLDLMPASQFQLDSTKELPHHRILLNSSRNRNFSGGNKGKTYGTTNRTPAKSKKRKQSGSNNKQDLPGPSPVFLGSSMDFRVPPIPAEMEIDLQPIAKKPFNAPEVATSETNKKEKRPPKTKNAKEKTEKKKKAKFKMAFTNRKIAKTLSSSGNDLLSAKADLSYMTEEERLLLASWGLPHSVVNRYAAKGVTSLFPWQLECLANERVLGGRNLLYSAPTSAGKTLVAEILMIKRVLELGKKAIMILPFVSVCREKMYSLQEIFGDAGIRVEGFMGAYAPPGGFKSVDIAICTIEKANSLINRLLEDNALSQLGTIVVDELHLIGDPNRGYLLELLLTKIKFMTSHRRQLNDSIVSLTEAAGVETKKLNIQVIGMSATLPNLDLLSSWIDAELVVTDFRPVPLIEYICFNGKIFDQFIKPVRNVKIDALPINIRNDESHLVYLSLETILAGHSVLIFCHTKAKCEAVAEQIAKEFFDIGSLANNTCPEIGKKIRDQLDGNKIREVLTQLEQCPGGLEEVLKKTVSFGVAFHHAGLTYDERDIIESAFKRSVLRVIVATSTLSAGVNLPARRVIISSPMTFRDRLDVMTYRQMCGRAGRKGVDTEGESILICSDVTKENGIGLVRSSLPSVKSALLGDAGALTSSMKRALLEVIASGIATRSSDVANYAKCTLLSKSIDAEVYDDINELPASQQNKDQTIQECLKYLRDNEFVKLQRYENDEIPDEYKATQLGSACLASSLAPDEGITVYKELQKARKCFVLESDLHVVYQVTPIYLSDQIRNIEWLSYLSIYNELSSEDKTVSLLVGVDEAFLMRAMIGSVSAKNAIQKEKFMIHQRFYAALALNDLVNEMPITEVSKKYSLNKGVIQNLQQAASTFAGMVTAFCGRLGWGNLELLLSQFQERLQFGVQRELCDLVRLSTMNGQRARILYDNGIKNVAELAAADPATVENILHCAAPFQSTVHGDGAVQRHIWMLGKSEGLNESDAAQKIVEEARQFIQMELGLSETIDFDNKKSGSKQNSKIDLLGSTEVSEEEEDTDAEAVGAVVLSLKIPTNSNASPHPFIKIQLVETSLENPIKVDLNKSRKSEIMFSEEMFNDTFPNINSEAFLADHNSPGIPIIRKTTNAIEGMEICQDILLQLVETSMNTSENDAIKENVTPKRDNYDADGNIIHSTPGKQAFLKSNIFARHRLSSISHHHASFMMETSPLAQQQAQSPKSIKDHQSNEINADLMAEFDKDFDSKSNLDNSLNVSKTEENNPTKLMIIPLEKLKVLENPAKLSDSDAAAMLFIANDSKFESEDMFADFENEAKANEINNLVSSTLESSTSAVQTLQTTSEFEISCETSTSIFENSSEYLTTDSKNMSARNIHNTPAPMFKAAFKTESGDHVVKVLKIIALDFIPEEIFKENNVISLGIKFSRVERSASAHAGIGSRVCRGRPGVRARNGATTRQHSIAIYSGGESLWIYHWNHSEPEESEYTRNKKKLVKLFRKMKKASCSIALFDVKDKLKELMETVGRDVVQELLQIRLFDPKIAQWLIHFNEDSKITIENVAELHLPSNRNILTLGWDREAVEAFVAWGVMPKMELELKERKLWEWFCDKEMPSIIPILHMEINGFGLDTGELCRMKSVLIFKSAVLEIRAFELAGKQFNIASTKDVKQILFHDLSLKPPAGRTGTGKDVLKKLDHDLPKVILEWRKVQVSLTKVVNPFQLVLSLDTGRVHGHYSHFTVTGRVVMSDPSIQCVPRDFDLGMDFTPDQIEEYIETCKFKFGTRLSSLIHQIDTAKELCSQPEYLKSNLISMRNVFVPCNDDFTILAADYSQLELRILTHLCQDKGLLEVIREGGDVMVMIASKWKNLPLEQITSSIRQEAKSILYGIVYGMGAKALSELLEVDEYDAAHFISDFKRNYPGIQPFLDKTTKFCRENGFIETICGRRRYLPKINSKNPADRAQAERQAINSKVQGSAADLMKTAMSKIHSRLFELYPKSVVPVNWKSMISVSSDSSAGNNPTYKIPKSLVYFPILNLHDELIFEVKMSHLEIISKEIKLQMESSLNLSVPLPVVIKCGRTWGRLEELTVNDL